MKLKHKYKRISDIFRYYSFVPVTHHQLLDGGNRKGSFKRYNVLFSAVRLPDKLPEMKMRLKKSETETRHLTRLIVLHFNIV